MCGQLTAQSLGFLFRPDQWIGTQLDPGTVQGFPGSPVPVEGECHGGDDREVTAGGGLDESEVRIF